MDNDLEQIGTLETRRRRLIPQVEGLKREQNAAGDEVARAKRQKQDATPIFAASKARAQQIKQLEVQLEQTEHQRSSLLLTLPNLPHASVPMGPAPRTTSKCVARDAAQVRLRTARPHWDLGPALGIIDFERATKMSGARFSVLLARGARLARALINFMLDLHTREHGYLEVEPPFLVNADACAAPATCPSSSRICSRSRETGTCYLIPTAEVPLTNLHRGEILDGRELPFATRPTRPASAARPDRYGADVRGLIRQHQFDKVELVKFTSADSRIRRARIADTQRRRSPEAAGASVSHGAAVHGRHGVRRPRRPTTSKSGCRARRPIARFHPAATPKGSRRGERTSASGRAAQARRSSCTRSTGQDSPSAAR